MKEMYYEYQDIFIHFYHLGNTKRFWMACARNGNEDYIFIIINHHILTLSPSPQKESIY